MEYYFLVYLAKQVSVTRYRTPKALVLCQVSGSSGWVKNFRRENDGILLWFESRWNNEFKPSLDGGSPSPWISDFRGVDTPPGKCEAGETFQNFLCPSELLPPRYFGTCVALVTPNTQAELSCKNSDVTSVILLGKTSNPLVTFPVTFCIYVTV